MTVNFNKLLLKLFSSILDNIEIGGGGKSHGTLAAEDKKEAKLIYIFTQIDNIIIWNQNKTQIVFSLNMQMCGEYLKVVK